MLRKIVKDVVKVLKHHSHNLGGKVFPFTSWEKLISVFTVSFPLCLVCLHVFSPLPKLWMEKGRGAPFILLITGTGVLLGALRWHQVIALVPRLVPLAPVGLAPTTFHWGGEGTLKGETSGTRGLSVEAQMMEEWQLRKAGTLGNKKTCSDEVGETVCLFEVDGWKEKGDPVWRKSTNQTKEGLFFLLLIDSFKDLISHF